MNRFDERDTIFSRLELVPGSKQYDSYYTNRPELKDTDDRLRTLSAGVYAHDRSNMARIDSAFRFLKDIRPLAPGPAKAENSSQNAISIKEIEQGLHAAAMDYGAVLYGQAVLGLECFYSVRGRGPAYGKPVNNPHRNALIFAVEMNRGKISHAPRPEEAVEVTRAYVRVAVIGMILSYFLRELGYEARCHMDGESELILPAAAQVAGLGEIGRIGLLLTPDFGPRVRLGAVTTNFPAASFSGSNLNEAHQPADYCARCDLCARRCPGKAIPFKAALETGKVGLQNTTAAKKADTNVAPETKNSPWKIEHKACFAIWKKFGTDCGICVSVCPYGEAQ